MRLGWLSVEVETIDRSVTVCSVDFLVRDPLSIQRHELVHACDAQVLRKLLIDPSGMHLIDANKLCCSLIKIEFLLNAGNDISDNAILSDEYIKLFLEQMSVSCLCKSHRSRYLFSDAFTEPCDFHYLFRFIVS
jgi:hypothetical protein